MAHPKNLLIFVAILSSCLLSASGELACEDLPVGLCAFAVSSRGLRCVLETNMLKNGDSEYECQTSAVTADEFPEWIETDDCVKACGLERMSVGMSSDVLLEHQKIGALCSSYCQTRCHNLVDLYTKLAAGEGVSLPQICMIPENESRRIMVESASKSGDVVLSCAPAPAPAIIWF